MEPIKLFFCCTNSSEDQKLREQLEKHIMVLKRLNEITLRLTRRLEVGTNWKYEQDSRFQTADLILYVFNYLDPLSTQWLIRRLRSCRSSLLRSRRHSNFVQLSSAPSSLLSSRLLCWPLPGAGLRTSCSYFERGKSSWRWVWQHYYGEMVRPYKVPLAQCPDYVPEGTIYFTCVRLST